ncbi:MAG: pantoate--beta-alanine ligase [Leptonema sp. (in: Bacteria)]|nr:pantoate--beta-alanine ligase [Leptonema sp. (in: bacteria)]
MKVAKNQTELQTELHQLQGQTIGFVPTMGFLHEGHLSLIRKSKQECKATVVSIFVNPLQFNDQSDLETYPRNINGDLGLLQAEGVDVVFLPSADDMYPFDQPFLKLQMPQLTHQLCGKYRPGHFDGMMFVVLKLFHIVQPNKAYFGKKDYQQLAIIKRMVFELSVPVEVIGVELIRETDGLAMSSRNARLSETGRQQATMIYRALKLVKKSFDEGKSNIQELTEIAKDVIETEPLNKVEYIEFVNKDTLEPVPVADNHTLVAAAIYTESVRLIDNLELGERV